MPTIQCALSLFRPGQETEAHRHTSTVIYHAFRGSGSSFVGDERFELGSGRLFRCSTLVSASPRQSRGI